MGKKSWTVYTPLGDWRGIWAYDETEAKEIVYRLSLGRSSIGEMIARPE